MRRSALFLPLLLALISPLTAVAPAEAASTRDISWTPCPEEPAAECGTLTVPLDWDRPRGQTIELAVARRPATDPAARIGALVINPGGPGGSGVSAIIDPVVERRMTFSPEITSRFDIVGFDPRGVARSHPIQCSLELALQVPDPLSIKDQAGFDALLAHNERYRQDCRNRTGPLFDHVDTGSVVRDLDALRAALGERKLTYYGVSYGTLIGQLYAERFPNRVRALALDSNMDHSLGTKAFLDTEAETVQDSFDEFVSWCETTASCVLHGRDVRAFWRDLLARAERGELPLPGYPDYKLTKLDVLGQAFGAFYSPAYRELADLLVALDSGASTARAILTPAAEPVINDPTQVFCQDYRLPIRDYREYAQHLRRAAAIAPDMLISPLAHSITAACLGSPASIPNPQHRLRVAGTPTLLMGNALHDPATPYSWAVSTARQIGHEARLLTYEGAGHGIYGRGECPTAAFDAYLTSLTVPAKGARCPAVPPAELSTLRAQPRPGPFPVLPGLPGWTRTPR